MDNSRTNGPIKARYEKQALTRKPFLDRARECSKYTIPTLIPPEGANEHTKFKTPYQGVGARGVNNIAAKLLLALFPPNSPFFKLYIPDDKVKAEIEQDPQTKDQIELALSKIEQKGAKHIESSNARSSLFEALRHLVVGGNILLYCPKDKKLSLQVYKLENYVVKRDPAGNTVSLITKETTVWELLPDKVKEIVPRPPEENADPNKKYEKKIDIYTEIALVDDRWIVKQEIEGKNPPDSFGHYPKEKCPWIPLRFVKVDGEDYGRGYVEEYLGDIISLEELMRSIVQGSVAAAKILFMVKPNSVTKKKTLENAENGDIVEGSADDVSTLQANKFNDFRVASETAQKITERLSHAFLMNTAIQRQAERVTAEVIRFMAQELEDAIGGIYSLLAQELQLPFIKLVLDRLSQQGVLPTLPANLVDITIVTGLEALGRGQEMAKLDTFLKHLSPLGPEVIAQYVNLDNYMTRLATYLGMDLTGLIKSKEEIAEEQARQQDAMQKAEMQKLMLNKGPDYIKAGTQAAQAYNEAQQPPTQ